MTPYQAQKVNLDGVEIPTTESSLNCSEAQLIVNYAAKLYPSGKYSKVTQYVREYNDGSGGGTQMNTVTPAVPPAFQKKNSFM